MKDITMKTDFDILSHVHAVADERVASTQALIVSSGIVPTIHRWRGADRPLATDRPEEVSMTALLTALLILTADGEPLTTEELDLLLYSRMSAKARNLVGMPAVRESSGVRSKERPARMRYIANGLTRLFDSMDPYGPNGASLLRENVGVTDHDHHDQGQTRQARLAEFSRVMLQTSIAVNALPTNDPISRLDLAIGTTVIVAKQPPVGPDHDRSIADVFPSTHELGTARGCRQTEDGRSWVWTSKLPVSAHDRADRRNNFAWGWEAIIAVRVDADQPGHSRVPHVVVAMSLSTPAKSAGQTLSVLRSSLESGQTPGVVHYDNWGDFQAETLGSPAAELGFTPSFEYRRDRLGWQGESLDAILVEGTYYCAAMPGALIQASIDFLDGRIDRDTYQSRIAERTRYQLGGQTTPVLPQIARLVHRAGCAGTDADPVKDPDFAHRSVSVKRATDVRSRQAFPYGGAAWSEFDAEARTATDSVTAAVHSHTRGEHDRLVVAHVQLTLQMVSHNLREIARFVAA
jgi:hypothetical protein